MNLSQRLANLSDKQRELLQKRLQSSAASAEPIAVVGMACRFPGAPDLDAYWRLIVEGRDGTSDIPPSRWNVDALFDPTGTQAGKMSVRRAGLVDGIDQFDPKFFGISPREAARMDPQQRLLLEVAWESLEVAAIRADQIAGTPVGVYVGIGGTDYSKVPSQYDGYYQYIDAHVGTGNALSIAANRVSYFLDVRGPSMAIDTACSSSTMAIHLAVGSLRNRECQMAIAGGVNAILTPETTIAFSKARMLSPDGRCRPFDASANGYVRGEGCGLIVLKRLTDAIADGDTIHGVLRASATNQDGRTSGITAPNGVSQQAVIRAALAQAGFSPDRVDHIEAHGTGTPLGDPIEVDALTRVFRRASPTQKPCTVTSVKANVGHMETVSGVAGIIKVLLMMRHHQIPGQLHLEQLNPNISLKNSRLAISADAAPWPAGGEPFVAGVSSFGFGGANTHVILEEYVPARAESAEASRPGEASTHADRTKHVVTLSGHSPVTLAASARRWLDLDFDGGLNDVAGARELADVAFTAAIGRVHFPHRAAIVTGGVDQLRDQLRGVAEGTPQPGVFLSETATTSAPRVAMVMTGQGSQAIEMGRRLMETQPVFRQSMQQCEDILAGVLPQPLLSVIYPPSAAKNGHASSNGHVTNHDRHEKNHSGATTGLSIDDTQMTQPALFAIEISLARLWQSWGIHPAVVLGHSVGEYVAMALAGCLSVEDALRLIARRARGMQSLPAGGKMLAILAPRDQVDAAIATARRSLAPAQESVAIAAINGPENMVVSGSRDAIDAVMSACRDAGLRNQPLTVSHAFHSPLMHPMLDEFRQAASQCEFHPPKIPLIANLTGELLGAAPSPESLSQHITGTVQFAASMTTLAQQDIDVVLEIGPSPVLIGMGRRCVTDQPWTWLPSLRPGQDDESVMLSSLAHLEVLGAEIDWRAFDRPWRRHRRRLPTTPLERSRFWLERSPDIVGDALTPGEISMGTAASHPLLGRRVPTAHSAAMFQSALSTRRLPVLADHAVQGSINLPAAGFLELTLAAAKERFGEGSHRIEDLVIGQALFLPASVEGEPTASRLVQTTIDESGGVDIQSLDPSRPDGGWTRHVDARLNQAKADDSVMETDLPPDYLTVRSRLVDEQSHDDFYEIMTQRRLEYGPHFRMLARLGRAAAEAIGDVELDATVTAQLADYHLHPVLGDALMQTLSALVPREADGSYSPYTYVPVGIRQARVLRPIGADATSWVTYGRRTSPATGPSPESVEGDLWLLDAEGHVVAELLGTRVHRVGRGSSETDAAAWQRMVYQIEWEAVEPSSDEPDHDVPDTAPELSLAGQAWLLIGHESEDADLLDELAERFSTHGARPIIVRPEMSSATELARLLKASQNQSPLAGVVDTRALSLRVPGGSDQPWDGGDVETVAGGMVGLLQAMLRETQPDASFRGWWVITRGAVAATPTDPPTNVSQSPMWGLVRVAQLEHPPWHPRLIDLDPTDPTGATNLLWQTLLGPRAIPAAEDQIAIREGRPLVARLKSATSLNELIAGSGATTGATPVTLPPSPYRLRFTSVGSFDSLRFETCERFAPVADEVELRVQAAGLNFSDVLKAMGLYPGITDPVVPLGIECAGVVTRVGPDVKTLSVGDEVMGVAPFSFASHAKTPEYTLVRRPSNMDPSGAASIPIAFLTAWYGLIRLADLQPGERVLIHAAAGGVGLAAIQIAQWRGAEVFATAGSPAKHDFLQAIGVTHRFSSRSLSFADEIRRVTGGEGVDVVLNSLPGEAITKSLSLLRAYGRFLEIGKTDIYQNRSIGLSPFRDNLSYHAIDLDRVLRQRPALIGELYAGLIERFAAGDLQPTACTEFAASEVTDAFRYMAQRKNIGKVVVRMPVVAETMFDEPAVAPESIGLEGVSAVDVTPPQTILITGGTGALGLRLAADFVQRGETHVALLARREPVGEVAAKIDQLNERADVVTLIGDVGDRSSLDAAIATLPKSFPPIATIIHAAGVLDDGLLMDMTPERLRRPMAAKVRGTWNLHAATLDLPIRHFVLFSSIASTLGSPGQANYAAANAFLDAMASHRRRMGLPAVSIAWGPWAESGMAATAGRDEQLRSRGMRLIEPAEGLAMLHELIDCHADAVSVMDVQWSRMLANLPVVAPYLAEHARDLPSAAKASQLVDTAFLTEIATLSGDGLTERLHVYFATELARLMGWSVEQINVTQPLSQLGMDSLIAMELKSNLEQRLGVQIPMAALVESPSITSLVRSVLPSLSPRGPSGGSVGTKANPPLHRSLVSLRPGTDAAPWVLVPPLGGSLSCYNELVRFAPAPRPVWGLLGRGSDGTSPPHASLDEMIDDFASSIDEAIPTGPLHLIGWSAGGIFAIELAQRFRYSVGRLSSLTLIDTPRPSIYDNVDPADAISFLTDFIEFSNVFLKANMRITATQLRRLPIEQTWQAVLDEAKRNSLLPAGASVELVKGLVATSSAHVEMIKSMRLPADPFPFHLIRPRDTTALGEVSGQDWSGALGWPEQLGRPVEVLETDGDHFSMLLDENAEKLLGCIESLQPAASRA